MAMRRVENSLRKGNVGNWEQGTGVESAECRMQSETVNKGNGFDR